MLAQLEKRADVETAEVDRRGELLRVRATAAVSVIREELERMGFSAEPVDETAAGTRWYGASDVMELSREEARVIAVRVVPPFAATDASTAAEVTELLERVAAALYGCFVEHRDAALRPGGLSVPCGRAILIAASPLVGAERAAALATAIEADLRGE